MSRSFKSIPIIKDKQNWMRKYRNRQERRRTRELIAHGEYEQAEGAQMPRGDYDICDYVFYRWDVPKHTREYYRVVSK